MNIKLLGIIVFIFTINLNASSLNQALEYLKNAQYTNAKKSFTTLCKASNAIACNKLAYMNENALGIKINKIKAEKLYKKACNLNLTEACYNLGILYSNSIYDDNKKSNDLIINSCNNGYAKACNTIGMMYNLGDSIRQDTNKSLIYLNLSCDGGYSYACYNLGLLYKNAQTVDLNTSIAKKYFGKACDRGHKVSCTEYKKIKE